MPVSVHHIPKKPQTMLKIILNMLEGIFTLTCHSPGKQGILSTNFLCQRMHKTQVFHFWSEYFRQLHERNILPLSLPALEKGLVFWIFQIQHNTETNLLSPHSPNEKRSTLTFQGSWNRFGSSENIFLRKGTFTSFITCLNTKFVWCWLTESLNFVCMTWSSV